jgi:hypothetical protein
MSETPIIETCFLCQQPFRFGPQVYRGRRMPEWDVMVCSDCYDFSWDGIAPSVRPHLVSHLESKGVPVKLNKIGWIDWPD